jgi:hypothetical protein
MDVSEVDVPDVLDVDELAKAVELLAETVIDDDADVALPMSPKKV